MYALGIDGGGTRTRAVLVDASGEIDGWRMGGCGNFQVVGLQGLESLLRELIYELGGQAKGGGVSLCLGLAGAGRPDEQAAIADLVRDRGWADLVCVVSDARVALEGAHGGEAGIIVIAGTGSIVLGKNSAGKEARTGGWGPLLGDEGSGYSIGLEALRAVFKARDGWGKDTSLSEELRRELGLRNWDEAVQKVYGGEIGRERIAGLGPFVFEAARGGDGVAQQIVESAGMALGHQVRAVARRLKIAGAVDLSGVGGVLKERDMLWPALERAAGRQMGELRWRTALLPPVMGAVLLARRQAGLGISEELIDRLVRTCPAGL